MPTQSIQSNPHSTAWVINIEQSPADSKFKKIVIVTSRATANTFLTGLAAIEYVACAILTVLTFGRSETVREMRKDAYQAMGTAFKGIVGSSTPQQEAVPPSYLQSMLASVRQYKVGAKVLDAALGLKNYSFEAFKYCKEHKTRCGVIVVSGAVVLLVALIFSEAREVARDVRERCTTLCKEVYKGKVIPKDCVEKCFRNSFQDPM